MEVNLNLKSNDKGFLINVSDIKSFKTENGIVTELKIKRKYGSKFKRPVVELNSINNEKDN